jgi:methionyl aminopeptidase
MRRQRIEIKSPAQLAKMRLAGEVVGRTLRILAEAVRPGISTAELDQIAEREIRAASAVPSFLGYHGYPATICASVDDEVVHGIPGPRTLVDGDIISIDCGAILDGWHGDAALTVGVGKISSEHQQVIDDCSASLWAGVAMARPQFRLGDISHAVERSVRGSGRQYGLVREYTGHGIGTAMHMDPIVPNYGPAGRGLVLEPGMALAIEPMITLGGRQVAELADGWTVVTLDGSWAAHFEHTVAITPDGPWVLTTEHELAPGELPAPLPVTERTGAG